MLRTEEEIERSVGQTCNLWFAFKPESHAPEQGLVAGLKSLNKKMSF